MDSPDLSSSPAAPMLLAAPSRLHDDIMCDILIIVGNSSVPVTTQDISESFRITNHRVDPLTIGNALNKTIANPASLFYAETREAIVKGKIIRSRHGTSPRWYETFHPQAKAVVKRKEIAPILQSDTKFDAVTPELNVMIDRIFNKPGCKKDAQRIRDLIEIGTVGAGQEKRKLSDKVDETAHNLKLVMQHLGITDESLKKAA